MILSKPFDSGKLVEFNSLTGLIESERGANGIPVGNCDFVEGVCVALFGFQGQLIFQVGRDKWDLKSDEVELEYFHNIASKKTYFKIADKQKSFSIEYESWWAGIPSFEPVEPEMDEDEDYMGYVFSVWRDDKLKQSLVGIWSQD